MADGLRLTAGRLRRLSRAILETGGSAAEEATLVADHLVLANLMGHDSHGVGMIPAYVRHLQAGLVVPNTRAKVVKDDGARPEWSRSPSPTPTTSDAWAPTASWPAAPAWSRSTS